jgi:hypothetical protein
MERPEPALRKTEGEAVPAAHVDLEVEAPKTSPRTVGTPSQRSTPMMGTLHRPRTRLGNRQPHLLKGTSQTDASSYRINAVGLVPLRALPGLRTAMPWTVRSSNLSRRERPQEIIAEQLLCGVAAQEGPDLRIQCASSTVIAHRVTEPFQRCRSRVRTAWAIDDIRFVLHRDLRKIRHDLSRATPPSTGARAVDSARLTVCCVA